MMMKASRRLKQLEQELLALGGDAMLLEELDGFIAGLATEHPVQMVDGRNDPCPCGSGKKYKKCCGLN
jgi:uncharacterized protein YecA (UPF0149 family)